MDAMREYTALTPVPAQGISAMEESTGLERADLERWLRALARRWWVIAACFVLVAASE